MAKKSKRGGPSVTQTFPIKSLKKEVFVRKHLDHDHAEFFADLMQNGTEFPPIKVTDTLEIIDGRHRVAAYEIRGLTQIECEVVRLGNRVELIKEAYRANLGGSLPPSQEDTEHTIMLLLELGESHKGIASHLRLPVGMTRKYINEVKSKLARLKLKRAQEAIAEEGLTVAKAAEQYGVDSERLKAEVSGKRRGKKQDEENVCRQLTSWSKSTSQRYAALLRTLVQKYEDGDISEKLVRSVFMKVKNLQRRAAHAVSEREKRFEALTKKNGG